MEVPAFTKSVEVALFTSFADFVAPVLPPFLLLNCLEPVLTADMCVSGVISLSDDPTKGASPDTIVQGISLTMLVACMCLNDVADQRFTSQKGLRAVITLNIVLLMRSLYMI